MYKIKKFMTSSPSPHRSPRIHPAPLVRNTIGSTARNVIDGFAMPLDQNGVPAAVTNIVPNVSATAAAPSSIFNNARTTFCDVDNYESFEVEPEMVCILYEAAIHGNCFQNQV
jgi:hypothetical protein